MSVYSNSNPNLAAETAPLTTMASAIFFGTILFTAIAMLVESLARGDVRTLQTARNPRSRALDTTSFASIYTLLHHLSIFGLILLYAYLCEYHPPFPHAPKSYDRDEFFFLTALLILVSLFTIKKNDPNQGNNENNVNVNVNHPKEISSTSGTTDKTVPPHHFLSGIAKTPSGTAGTVAPVNEATEFLNRDQTEEWKGWMQFMFLLYHYHHAEEVYNGIRVMITCYVFMTGFGNFSFFYIKGDYSSTRVMQMLWRLDFLVIFLCLTQGTTYILYYICLLHTYFFLMVYVTMRVAKHVNYTVMGLRLKLAVLALIIFLVWDVDTGIFRLVHWPFLSETPMLGATLGSMWEWYFRSTLDHWSTFLGMVFALNFPITSLFFRKLEAQPFLLHVGAKAFMSIVFGAATYWWVTGPFMHPKYEYNQTNAYFAWFPLYAYIYFRNLTPWLRNHTLDLLHQIGKSTLETYLLQHHIWLTSDAKSLLTLIPGWPKMNFLLVTVIYFILSRRLYTMTLFLRGMLLPNDRNACLRNLFYLTASISVCLALAFILQLVQLLNLLSVAFFSVLFGFLLYRLILSRTSLTTAFEDASLEICSSGGDAATGGRKRIWSPLLGALAVVSCGAVWNHFAQVGASKVRPLPKSCDVFVNKGAWLPMDSCNEASAGILYRDYGIGSLGTCSPLTEIYTWGWEATPSSSLCRFAPRAPKSILASLNHRRVVFVGDSSIRNLYHALCRQLGDKQAGAYNTTIEKWSDFSKVYRNVAVEFKWAPYTVTLSDTLRTLTSKTDNTNKKVPDLIVVGGGAWDRLHHYTNDTERLARTKEIQTLATEMKALRLHMEHAMPLVWVVPTTINNWALMTEEKRANIREEDMAGVRELYKKEGIHDSVSFVLDGPAYTVDRVAESHDGVHYPLAVYDAGAQILANAMDWLVLHDNDIVDPFLAPVPGSMANPLLGLMVLCIVFVGIFFKDGFLGISYLAGLVVPSVRPSALFEEAFTSLHSRLGLPAMNYTAATEFSPLPCHQQRHKDGGGTDHEHSKSSDGMEEDESNHAEFDSLLKNDKEAD